MSHNEGLRQAVVETTNNATTKWNQHQGKTREELGYILSTLRETDEKVAGFGERIAQALRTYERDISEHLTDSIKGIEKGHERLTRVLEGATHPDAVEGLEKIGQARQASTEILPGSGHISETIAADLAQKVEALRAVLRLAQVQISNPELNRDEAAAIARTLAPGEQPEHGMDADVYRHVHNGTNELNLFIQEI